MSPEATTATPQDLEGQSQEAPKGQAPEIPKNQDGQVDKVKSTEAQAAPVDDVPSDPEVLKQSYLQAKELEKKLGQQGQELGELREAKKSLDWLKAQPWFVEEARRRLNPQAAAETPPAPKDDEEPFEIPETKAAFRRMVNEEVEKRIQSDPDKQVVREIQLEKEFARLESEGCTDIRAKRPEMTNLFVQMGQPKGVSIEDLYYQVKGREARLASRNGGTKPAVAIPPLPSSSEAKQKVGTSSPGMVPLKTEMKVRTIADASAKALKDLGLDKD